MSRLSGSARETAVITIGEHLARSVRGVPVAPPGWRAPARVAA